MRSASLEIFVISVKISLIETWFIVCLCFLLFFYDFFNAIVPFCACVHILEYLIEFIFVSSKNPHSFFWSLFSDHDLLIQQLKATKITKVGGVKMADSWYELLMLLLASRDKQWWWWWYMYRVQITKLLISTNHWRHVINLTKSSLISSSYMCKLFLAYTPLWWKLLRTNRVIIEPPFERVFIVAT